MTIDKEKLKALAKAANAVTTDVNITMAVGADPVEVKIVQDYLQVAMPKTILALLAEIEQLRDSHEQVCTNYNRASFASEERGKQVDQLKAENEALRKDRIPSGFYRELVALRELRDQAKKYVDGYLLDEVEDVDSCLSVEQHLSAAALSERLMDAFEAHWDAAMAKESSHG
ncbi:hypothetical protein D3C77_226150 [compost metagenome]